MIESEEKSKEGKNKHPNVIPKLLDLLHYFRQRTHTCKCCECQDVTLSVSLP